MIHRQDMPGEHEGAGDQQQISRIDGEAALDAEQVQADGGDRDGQPYGRHHPPAHENPRDGHQQDIQRRQKTGFAGRGVKQRRLLQVGGDRQQQPAEDTAAQQASFAPCAHLYGLVKALFAGILQQDHRHERQRADDGPRGHEGERADVLHAHALGHKGGAPDEGSQEQQQVAPHLLPLPQGSTCSSARYRLSSSSALP